MEQFADKIFRGQGPVFIGDIDANNNPVDMVYVGDVSQGTISPSVSRGKHMESHTGARGTVGSWITETAFSLALTMHSIRPQHLKAALQGVLTSKVGASVTNEVKVASHDGFIALNHVKLSAVTVTDVAGTTTYSAVTDYVLHADEGMIEVLSTGTITDGQTLHIDYTYAAQYHVSSNPGNTAKYVVFAGMNTADNDKQTRCEMYRVKFDPAALPLITNDAAGMTLNGTLELDSSRAAGDQYFSWKVES